MVAKSRHRMVQLETSKFKFNLNMIILYNWQHVAGTHYYLFLNNGNDQQFFGFRIECKLVRARYISTVPSIATCGSHKTFWPQRGEFKLQKFVVVVVPNNSKPTKEKKKHRLCCLIKRNRIESRVSDRSCSTFWLQPFVLFYFPWFLWGFFGDSSAFLEAIGCDGKSHAHCSVSGQQLTFPDRRSSGRRVE